VHDPLSDPHGNEHDQIQRIDAKQAPPEVAGQAIRLVEIPPVVQCENETGQNEEEIDPGRAVRREQIGK
jgi:hypothetical protein